MPPCAPSCYAEVPPTLELAVLILSSPKNGVARDAVRQAWAHAAPKSCPCETRFWFVIGDTDRATRAEGDLLLVNAAEGYRNVTRKVIAAFRWLLDQSISVSYVFKTDDDAFVCTGGVMRMLRLHRPLYAGIVMPHQKVITKPDHPWRDVAYSRTFHAGAQGRYADYFQGAGYALRLALVRTVVRNADRLGIDTMEPPPSNEDAWVGALARVRTTSVGEDSPGSAAVALAPNQSLELETPLPAAQWLRTSDNLTHICAAGYLLVHKLQPTDLLECARAAAALPPFCQVRRYVNVHQQAAWRDHAPRSASGKLRCACLDVG